MRTLALVIFLLLFGSCLAHAIHYHPMLPAQVASHFGPSGQADAWSGKTAFIAIYLVAAGMNGLLFLAIGYGIAAIPDSLINLPNKGYWLSPERREHTFNTLTQYFLWFGSATFLLLLDIFHQSFQVHLGKTGTLQHPFLSIGLYLGFALVWTLTLVLHFGRVKKK